MLFTYALTDAKNVATSSGIIQSAFAQFAKHLTKESLALAKAQVLFDIQNTRQQRQSRAGNMVQQWHRYGVIYSEKDMQKALNAITLADVSQYVSANSSRIVMVHVNAKKK